MEWFSNNWPTLLIGLGAFILVSGLIRKLAKLAFLGVGLAVLGFLLWPTVSSSF